MVAFESGPLFKNTCTKAWSSHCNCLCRLKEAQLSVRRITGEKKVETRKINPNSLVRHDSLREIFSWFLLLCGWKHTSKHKHHFLSTERAAPAERSQLVFSVLTNVEQTEPFFFLPKQPLFDKCKIQLNTFFFFTASFSCFVTCSWCGSFNPLHQKIQKKLGLKICYVQ